MYLYTGCAYVISLSLSLSVGVHPFSDGLITEIKGRSVGSAVNFTALYMGTRYPVLHCERVDTKYGESVRLTLREDAEDNIIRYSYHAITAQT